jgi:AGZA family xanthine/uracil permease-like MFS transporter
VLIKALAGRFRDLNPALVILAAIFVVKFAFGASA